MIVILDIRFIFALANILIINQVQYFADHQAAQNLCAIDQFGEHAAQGKMTFG